MHPIRRYLTDLPLLLLIVGGSLFLTHSAGSQVGAVAFPVAAAALRHWLQRRRGAAAEREQRDPALTWLVFPAVLLAASLLELRWGQGLDLTQGVTLGAFVATALAAPQRFSGWWSPVRWLATSAALLLPAWFSARELAPGALLAALRLAVLADFIRMGLSRRDVRPDRFLDAVGLGVVIGLQQDLFWLPVAVLAAATAEHAAHGAFSSEVWAVRPAHDRPRRWLARGSFVACLLVTALACTWSVYQLAPLGRQIHEVGPVAASAVSRYSTETFRALKHAVARQLAPLITHDSPGAKPGATPEPSIEKPGQPPPSAQPIAATNTPAPASAPAPRFMPQAGMTTAASGQPPAATSLHATGEVSPPPRSPRTTVEAGRRSSSSEAETRTRSATPPSGSARSVGETSEPRAAPVENPPGDARTPPISTADSSNAASIRLPASVRVTPERASSSPDDARSGEAARGSAIAFMPPSLGVPSLPVPPLPTMTTSNSRSPSPARDAAPGQDEPRFDAASLTSDASSGAKTIGAGQQSASSRPLNSMSGPHPADEGSLEQAPGGLRLPDSVAGVADPGLAATALATTEPASARPATASQSTIGGASPGANATIANRAGRNPPLPMSVILDTAGTTVEFSPSNPLGAGDTPPRPAEDSSRPTSASTAAAMADRAADAPAASSDSSPPPNPAQPPDEPAGVKFVMPGSSIVREETVATASPHKRSEAPRAANTRDVVSATVESPAASEAAPRSSAKTAAAEPRPNANLNAPAETRAPSPKAAAVVPKVGSTSRPALVQQPKAVDKPPDTAAIKEPEPPPLAPPPRFELPDFGLGRGWASFSWPLQESLFAALALLAMMILVRRWRARRAGSQITLGLDDRAQAGRCLWAIENLLARRVPPGIADELTNLHRLGLCLRYGLEFSRDQVIHLEREARRLQSAIDAFERGLSSSPGRRTPLQS